MAQPKENKTSFMKNFKSEFNQIKWPTWPAVVNKTMIVLFISFVVTALIYGFDTIYNFVLGKFFL